MTSCSFRCLLLVVSLLALAPLGADAQHKGRPQVSEGEPTVTWRQWLGEARDGAVTGFTEPRPWPEELTEVWSRPSGGGYSSLVGNGKIVYLHDRDGDNEVVRALELSSGDELWSDHYPTPSLKTAEFAESEGEGPYATPILHRGHLFTVGVDATVTSYRADDGTLRWRRHFPHLIVEVERFCGIAASPLIFGERLVLQVGDDDSSKVLALDVETGETLWSWSGAGVGNASPIVAQLAGVNQIVATTDQAVVGLEPGTGRSLWQQPFPAGGAGCSTNIPTPMVHRDSLLVSAIDRGTMRIEPELSASGWAVQTSWTNRTAAPHLGSVVVDGNELFVLSTKGKGRLMSLDAGSGTVLWKGKGRTGEDGFAVDLGDSLLVLMNDGDLIVARKTRPGLEIERRYTVSDATVWSYPLLTEAGILVRDRARLTFWRVR